VCSASTTSRRFCGATDKTVAHFVLRPKPKNRRGDFDA
jgi:hypothetical protein